MAAKYLRRQTWWVRFYHPRTGALMRGSLETGDSAKAELLRQRVELEAALLEPRFQAAELPSSIQQLVSKPGLQKTGLPLIEVPTPTVTEGIAVSAPASKPRTPIDTALKTYLDFIRTENSEHHVAGKLSMMRRFFGSRRIEALTGRAVVRGSKSANGHPPFFKGAYVDEITALVVHGFMDQLEVSKKTKRHYREFFHHFLETCMKFDLLRPTNLHHPNPIAALPSYVSRNRRIVFLTQDQIDRQLDVLKPVPRLRIAVAIMIYAGLRRAEMLWLNRAAISSDMSFFSVVNRLDEDRDIESTLKTGDRAVTILPPLKSLLCEYLKGHDGEWLVPSPTGLSWDGDGFGKKLRELNRAAGLKWTCLHYRHTYATQRAAEAWPLFRIAKEMGNSVSVVEEYYAGFIRPAEIAAISSNN